MIFRLSVYIGHCKGQRPMQPGPNTRVGERVKGREGGRERVEGREGEGGRERKVKREDGRERDREREEECGRERMG